MRPNTLCLLTLALPFASAVAPSPAPVHPHFSNHPHFSKTVEVQLPGMTLTVNHITVTFDKKGAEAMKPGGAWHLGGAQFDTSADVKIGGVDVAAGSYSLKVRKNDDDGWDLVLDEPTRFVSRISKQAKALKTAYDDDAPLFEHLSIDIQPAGDKSSTQLFLDVRFDRRLARCLIELPPGKRQDR